MKLNKGLFLILTLFSIFLAACKSTPTTPLTPSAPTIEKFDANPGNIVIESSSTLSWSVTNATKVEIDQGIGQVSLTGTKTVSPTDTTTYTLTAFNGNLQSTKTCTITVEWKPFIVYITDTGAKYHRGDCQYLSQSKIQTTLGDACSKGYSDCSVCKPPKCR